LVTVLFVLSTICFSQTINIPKDFEITLERTACLGACPDYKVVIHANGSMLYQGRYSVETQGTRKSEIPISEVQKLVERLRKQGFFNWKEKKLACIDFPEVEITVVLDGRRKHVLEGCNEPGPILKLADEIDRISGAKRWIGKAH
jgi:hypothetical protein